MIRTIEIIGEAAAQIHRQAPEFAAAHPELPWLEMRDMRNRMIHAYFHIYIVIVWDTVKNDLPPLKRQIERLLHQVHKPEPDRSR